MHQLSREAHWFVCCGLIVICSCAILFPISSCQFLDIQFNGSHKQEKSALRYVMVLLYGQFSQHWCQNWAVDEEYKLQDFAQVIKRWFFFSYVSILIHCSWRVSFWSQRNHSTFRMLWIIDVLQTELPVMMLVQDHSECTHHWLNILELKSHFISN